MVAADSIDFKGGRTDHCPNRSYYVQAGRLFLSAEKSQMRRISSVPFLRPSIRESAEDSLLVCGLAPMSTAELGERSFGDAFIQPAVTATRPAYHGR
ncbi:hypothetical protein Tco_0547518 [Tanacetum coccineum]